MIRGGSHRISRREFAIAGAAASLVAARARADQTRTLRFIARSDLRILDPIWTTAYVSRNHGYMVFDTLFALTSTFTPRPQMVGEYCISPDQMTYRFALRNGLKFHDGEPVRGVDCVASLRESLVLRCLQGAGPEINPNLAEPHGRSLRPARGERGVAPPVRCRCHNTRAIW